MNLEERFAFDEMLENFKVTMEVSGYWKIWKELSGELFWMVDLLKDEIGGRVC